MKDNNDGIRTEGSPSLFHKVRAGGFWVFMIRIMSRVFGVVKIVVVARLLSPEEFGLFGIAMLAVSICDTFTQSGFEGALIHKKEDVAECLDTAWTIQVIRGIVLFFILFSVSFPAAIFFKAPEVSLIVKVIAASQLVSGFKNIGVIYFSKELDFHKDFLYQFIPSFMDLILSIALLFLLRNVWALVISLLLKHLITTVWSYFVHDYRPRLKLEWEKAKDLFQFGKWALGSAILYFLLSQGDDILVAKVLGTAVLGLYLMAYKISNIPTTEITNVISYVTFPAFSKLQNDTVRLRNAYLQVLKVIMFTTFPLALLLFFQAKDFTKIFLGDVWLPMVPAMQILCVFGLIGSYGATIRPLFYGMGKPKIHTALSFLQLVLLTCSIYPLTRTMGILGAAISVTLSMLVTQIISSVYLVKLIRCKYFEVIKLFLFPFLGAALMGLLVTLSRLFLTDTSILNLIVVSLVGLISYVGVSLLFSKLLHYDGTLTFPTSNFPEELVEG